METHRIESIDAIFNFILAGIAVFTISNSKTGNRFTYRVVAKEVSPGTVLFFVAVLTGSNNESDYAFLGTIFDDGIYRHGRKSRIGRDALSTRAFGWLMGRLETHTDLGPVDFYHEGKCARCGRKLTTPESIERGLGPVCAEKMAA